MLLLNTQDRIQLPHSWVYKSPQELNGGRSPPRMSNDVFSFGSTLYEVGDPSSSFSGALRITGAHWQESLPSRAKRKMVADAEYH